MCSERFKKGVENMSDNTVYILVSYHYYDSEVIHMVSRKYSKVKKHFKELLANSKNGRGYIIYKYTLDKYYPSNDSHAEAIDWICKDYAGQIKDLTKI